MLRQLAVDGRVLIGGLPWVRGGEALELPIGALTARVLCARHNSALAPLDDRAGGFFGAIKREDLESADPATRGTSWVVLFNGHDIERWMLKVLCGLMVSGNMPPGKAHLGRQAVPGRWLRMLFGSLSVPSHWGLYLQRAEVGYVCQSPHPFCFKPLEHDGRLCGAVIALGAFAFALNVGLPREAIGRELSPQALHRPKHLVFAGRSGARGILVGWDRPGADKGLTLTRL
ncbi:MAG: hypothetical protein FJX75_17775 [Armatimonadetes bacterium]|nr:hypothetical protein [Armatimonadota bacterium]